MNLNNDTRFFQAPKKSNKRKADEDEDDDDFAFSLLDWYTNDDLIMGKILT